VEEPDVAAGADVEAGAGLAAGVAGADAAGAEAGAGFAAGVTGAAAAGEAAPTVTIGVIFSMVFFGTPALLKSAIVA